jgi:hypothetical protein
MKKRVTGLGGVFFKSHDPEAIKLWYQKHLDIQSGEHGALFHWRYSDNPSKKNFMFNYRVENLVEVVGEIEEYSYGKFAWIMDPNGNKVELWEPIDENTL